MTIALRSTSTVGVALLALIAGCRERTRAVDRNDAPKSLASDRTTPRGDKGAVPPSVRTIYPGAPGSFVDLVGELAPSIVHIASTASVTGGPDELFPGSGAGTALGSGFVIDRDGYVITSDRVIARAAKLEVVLADGSRNPARIAGRDPKLDIALLKIDARAGLQPVRLGSADALRVGEWVVTVGNPFGGEVTATSGIVSALGRTDRDELVGAQAAYRSFIRIDSRIDAASAGGPVANMAGEVVGVATVLDAEKRGAPGFAVPIDRAAQVLPMLKKDGVVTRSWLGIYIHPVDGDRSQTLGLSPGDGALVSDLVVPGPAAKAGVQVGDVIVSVDDRPVTHRSLPWLASTAPVGTPLQLLLWRGGAQKTIDVVPERMPD
jgi:serine protease Do